MTRALIPGTYDPVTLGHLDIIERSSQIFGDIVVGVAASYNKGSGPIFSLEQRVAFIQEATAHLGNCRVVGFDNLLVDFAEQVGALAIVKGLRAVTDFEWEFQQAAVNYHLNPQLETVFVMANPANMYLSSSMIKEIAAHDADVSAWVTPTVRKALSDYYNSAKS